MVITRIILASCFFILTGLNIYSQDALSAPLSIYRHQIGAQYGIYNGPVYELATNINQGHPFFYDDSLLQGEVYYDDFRYTNVLLMLDEEKDELITPDFSRRFLIQLLREKVDSFSIAGNRFVKRNIGEGSAYFQLLYSRASQLMKKEIKKVTTNIIGPNEAERTVEAQTRHYLVIDGQVKRIKNRRSFLKLLAERGTKVKSYLKRTGINYRTTPDEYFTEGIKHYDELAR